MKFRTVIIAGSLLGTLGQALGQVTVDSSFGNAGALAGPNFQIPDTLGNTVGGNLFHSFSDFNIQTGESATFTGPDSINNILGRVTGGDASSIDGLIRSEITGANLYLMNPNGFLFGENAKVDVDGAFTLSSRDRINLGKDGVFLARQPNNSVLTASPPQAFGFLGGNPSGKISFDGTRLVTSGSVNVAGGEVTLNDARLVSESSAGNSGDIIVESDGVTIRKGQLRTESMAGDAGRVIISSRKPVLIEDPDAVPDSGEGLDRGEFIDNIRNRDVAFGDETGILSLANGGGKTAGITIAAPSITIKGAGIYSVTSKGESGELGDSGNISLSTGAAILEHARVQLGSGLSTEPAETGISVLAQNGMSLAKQSYLFSEAGLSVSGGVAIVDGSLVEAQQSKVTLGGGMKLNANSAWNTESLEIASPVLEVYQSTIRYEDEAAINLARDLKLVNNSEITGNMLEPSTLALTGRNVLVGGRSQLDAGLGIDMKLTGDFDLSGESRVQVGIDRLQNPDAVVSFPEGQQVGHLNLKARSATIAEGEWESDFKLFTPYGGTMNLDIANNFDIESNGEVYLTDYAGNTASKMTVQAGSLSIDAAGLRADEMDIDVTGLLKIGEPEAVYSSGIYGGPNDPRLIDITAGEVQMFGTGGIVLQKDGVNEVYRGAIRLDVTRKLTVDRNTISTRGYYKHDQNNVAVGSIDITAANMRLQNNAKIDLPAGMVPEGVEVGGLNVDIDSILQINNSTISASVEGAASDRADVFLSATILEMNGARLEHVGYFSEVYNQGARYLRDVDEPVFLSGHGSMSLSAESILVARTGTHIEMHNGALKLGGQEVSLDGISLDSITDWQADGLDTALGLSVKGGQQLVIANSRLGSHTITGGAHHEFEFEAPVVEFRNNQLTMLDEVAGGAGNLSLRGANSVTIQDSELTSIGMNTVDPAVNGNDILIEGRSLMVKSSVINTTVRGGGDAGTTKINATGAMLLTDSWIGGVDAPLGQAQNTAIAIDDTLGDAANITGGVIDSSYGLGKGENVYYSLAKLELRGGDRLAFGELGADQKRVLTRVTGGESSVLDGTVDLGAKQGDLILMNPSGFTVGPNAQFESVGALTLFTGSSVEFDGGSSVNLQTAADALPGTAPIRFVGGDAGAIDVIGTTLDQANLSLVGGDVSFRSGASAMTIDGSPLRLDVGSLNLSGGSVVGTSSPEGGIGGAIQIEADTLNLNAGNIRTVALGGQGGAVEISGGSFVANGGVIESLSFPGANANGRAGAVSISMADSIRGTEGAFVDAASYGDGGLSPVLLSAPSVVLDGPDFDRASGVQMIAYQGPTSSISIAGNQVSAPMGRLINEARNDAGLVVGEDYGAISITGRDVSLGHKIDDGLPKTVATSLSFFTHSKNSSRTGDIRVSAENDLNLGGVSILQEGLLLAGKGFVESGPVGRGGDALFKGRNVIGQATPDPVLWFDSHYTGNLTFEAEDQLTLGLSRFIYVNSDPSSTHALTLKGKNISLGYEEQFNQNRWGTSFLLVHDDIKNYTAPNLVMRAEESIQFHPGFQTNDDFDTVGPNKGIPGGHGVSSVDIQAQDIVFNASKLSLHSNFEHHIAAAGSIQFTKGSQIELSDSDTVNLPVVKGLMLEAGTLEMDGTTYLRSWSESRYAAGDLGLKGDTVRLNGARVFSENLANGGAGNIQLTANEIDLSSGARVQSLMRAGGDAGDIGLEAGTVRLAGSSAIQSGVALPGTGFNPSKHQPGAHGDAGDITINAATVRLDEGSSLSSMALDIGRSGDVTVTGENIQLDGRAYISSSTDATQWAGRFGIFDSTYDRDIDQNGSITLAGENVTLTGGAYLKSTTRMPHRQAGSIALTGGQIDLTGGSSVISNTEPSAMIDAWRQHLKLTGPAGFGDAGEVTVNAAKVNITDKSRLASDSFTDGNAGRIAITSDEVAITEIGRVYAGALNEGDGGAIEIEAGQLRLAKRGAIVADVRDSGDGGTVHIKADEMIVDGASVYGSTSGEGQGSRVKINSGDLRLAKGGRIESAAFGLGPAGELEINASRVSIVGEGEWFDPKDVDAEPSGEIARSGLVTGTVAEGEAGTIHLTTPDLALDAGLIGSASTGTGEAGSINVNITGQMVLQNDGQVSVRSSQADGGDITINTSGHVLVDNSELSASAKQDGGSVRLYGDGNFFFRDGRITAEAGQDGGNIFVEAPETLVLNRARLSANAIYGHGGYILITADGFLPSVETSITASSEFGVEGTVEIRTPDTDVGSGLVILPEALVSRNINLAERCALRLSGDVSSFFLNGEGGIPVWSSQSYLPSLLDNESE